MPDIEMLQSLPCSVCSSQELAMVHLGAKWAVQCCECGNRGPLVSGKAQARQYWDDFDPMSGIDFGFEERN